MGVGEWEADGLPIKKQAFSGWRTVNVRLPLRRGEKWNSVYFTRLFSGQLQRISGFIRHLGGGRASALVLVEVSWESSEKSWQKAANKSIKPEFSVRGCDTGESGMWKGSCTRPEPRPSQQLALRRVTSGRVRSASGSGWTSCSWSVWLVAVPRCPRSLFPVWPSSSAHWRRVPAAWRREGRGGDLGEGCGRAGPLWVGPATLLLRLLLSLGAGCQHWGVLSGQRPPSPAPLPALPGRAEDAGEEEEEILWGGSCSSGRRKPQKV